MPDSTPIELRTAAQTFQTIFDAMGEGYCLFDGAGLLHSWNSTLEAEIPELVGQIKVGISYEQFLVVSLSVGLDKSILSNFVEGGSAQLHRLSMDEKLEFELSLSQNRWFKLSRVNMECDGWLLVYRNITKMKQEREALLLSEEKFERFARLASNWFWELDENLCYLYHSTHEGAMFTDDVAKAKGTSRIDTLVGRTNDNDQLREHNACLLAHESVDVVLSWGAEGSDDITYSHVLAEPRFDSRGAFIGYIGCGRDVTVSQQLSRKFKYQANHDYLTGLKNRRAFESYLDGILGVDNAANVLHESDSVDTQYTLLSLDLDRFKLINDDVGHAAGDQLLVQIAQLLKNVTGNCGIVARIGGDEFGVCLSLGVNEAEALTETILEKISNHPFEWKNRRFSIGASAGLAAINPAETSGSMLMKNADAACYSAKMLGRNRKEVFSKNNYFQAQQSAELEILRTLRYAMDNDRMELYLQSIVTAQRNDNADKYEILLRIIDDHGEVVSPGAFIPTAEKYDLMQEVDLLVVKKSISAIREFIDVGANVSLSINLSGNTLGSEKCMVKIAELVKQEFLPENSLCFEITETAAIHSLELVVVFMAELKQYGCQFALDDFGSGLSSYGYLESLDVDYIKIDGSFIKKITSEKTSQAIVKSINTLSHEMGMKTVAEFVENKDIADSVIAMDIDYLQGYHYGKPASINDVLDQYLLPYKKTGTG